MPRAEGLPADLMQKIAREMNLSETVFVVDLRKDDFEEKRGLGNQESGAAKPVALRAHLSRFWK